MVGDGGGGVTVVVVYTRGARSRTRGEGGVVKVVIALTLRGRWEGNTSGEEALLRDAPGGVVRSVVLFFCFWCG